MRSFAGSSVVLLPLRGGGDIKGIRRGGKSSGNRELGSKSWCLRTNVDAIVKLERMRSDWFKTEAWRDDEHTNIKSVLSDSDQS
jgi:hypothetical protein